MTKAIPVQLPDDFSWVEPNDGDDWCGARLELAGRPILQISACRAGWLVTVLLDDPLNPQANVAVRSIPAGMRWSARWARARADRLRVLARRAEARNQPPATRPERITETADV